MQQVFSSKFYLVIIYHLTFLIQKLNSFLIEKNKLKTMYSYFIYLYVLIIQSYATKTNLILNGDFENHPPLNLRTTCAICPYYYSNLEINNYVGYDWYDGDNITIQFRSKLMYATYWTTVIDSCAKTNTKLMQDIQLKQNGLYRFTFDMSKNQMEKCNYLSSWIGNQQIYNMEKTCIDLFITYEKIFRWYKTQITSVLFIGYNQNYLTKVCVVGPLLDNVTLVQLQQINRTLQLSIKPAKSIKPCLQISINLTLTDQQPNKLSKLSEKFNYIQNNRIIYTDLEMISSSEGNLIILLPLQKDIIVSNLTIEIQSFMLNDTIYNFFSGKVQLKQPLTFLFNSQLKISNFLNQLNQPFSNRLKDTVLLSRFIGLGSIFLDIFSFWQIAIFYHYVGIETPSFVKYSAQESFKSFLLFGLYKEIQIDSYVYPSSNFSMQQKIPLSNNRWYWFYELGYTSNYYKNNIQPYTLIGLGLIRSTLFQLIFLMVGFKLFCMKRKWYKNLTYDIVSWIPFLLLVPAITICSSFSNFPEKLNYMLHILTMFFCLLTPPLFLVTTIQNFQQKHHRTSKKLHKKKIQTIYIFLEFMFICCLTFLTGIKNKDIFLLVSSSLIVSKIIYLIRFRKCFGKLDFFFRIIGGIIWGAYTFNFILFRVIQLLIQKGIIMIEQQGIGNDIFNVLGISVLIIFTLGGWIYAVITCINFIFEVKNILWKIKKACLSKLIKNKVQDIQTNTNKQANKINEQNRKVSMEIKKINIINIQQSQNPVQKEIKIFIMRDKVQQIRLKKTVNIKQQKQKDNKNEKYDLKSTKKVMFKDKF